MGLFTKKKSSFINTGVNLGSSRPVYLKPTKKELGEITLGSRLSSQPHGIKPKSRSSFKRHYKQGKALVADFQQLNPTSVNEFSDGFRSYNSKSHLDRNLGL